MYLPIFRLVTLDEVVRASQRRRAAPGVLLGAARRRRRPAGAGAVRLARPRAGRARGPGPRAHRRARLGGRGAPVRSASPAAPTRMAHLSARHRAHHGGRRGDRWRPLDLHLPVRAVRHRRLRAALRARAASPSRRCRSVLYTGIVVARTVLPLIQFFDAPHETTALELVTMFLNAATLLVVAIVAGGLGERYRATRAGARDPAEGSSGPRRRSRISSSSPSAPG